MGNLLKNTLLYHVIPNAAIKSTDLAPDQSVPTANGAPVRVQVDQRGVTVNGVKVVKADVKTSAGIVHVVEKVIPTVANDAAVRSSSNGNIADELTNAGLTTLLDLVVKADLVDTLLSVAPATIFAPTNDAFDELLADPATTKALAADPNLLKNTLLYHVIPNAAIKSTDLAPDQSVPTANGAPVRVQVDQRGVTVNGVKVVKADVKTSAGIVHVVEKVIPTVANDAAVRSSSNGNIADELTNAGLTTLLDLVVKADLVDTLLSVAPATI